MNRGFEQIERLGNVVIGRRTSRWGFQYCIWNIDGAGQEWKHHYHRTLQEATIVYAKRTWLNTDNVEQEHFVKINR